MIFYDRNYKKTLKDIDHKFIWKMENNKPEKLKYFLRTLEKYLKGNEHVPQTYLDSGMRELYLRSSHVCSEYLHYFGTPYVFSGGRSLEFFFLENMKDKKRVFYRGLGSRTFITRGVYCILCKCKRERDCSCFCERCGNLVDPEGCWCMMCTRCLSLDCECEWIIP